MALLTVREIEYTEDRITELEQAIEDLKKVFLGIHEKDNVALRDIISGAIAYAMVDLDMEKERLIENNELYGEG